MRYFVGIDVGGTFIKSAVIDNGGNVLDKDISITESCSKESKEIIISNLVKIIEDRINSFPDKIFSGIGIAFPGPFDYDNGISYITGIDKYEGIYGVNIKECLLQHIKGNIKNITPDFNISFENDAAMFALGEYLKSSKEHNKVFTLCIGTGSGSAYIENGVLVKDTLPNIEDGWIYNIPYKESIIDDYISSRGILKIAKDNGLDNVTVKDVAGLALLGDEAAKKVWNEFGENLKEVLVLVTKDFNPSKIVIGGQISKSYNLFIDSSREYFNHMGVNIVISDNTSVSTIVGSSLLFS